MTKIQDKVNVTIKQLNKSQKLISFWIIIWLLLLGYWSFALAMASKPPSKEEPKYKLEILKMEVVPAPQAQTSKKILMIIAHKNFQDREFSIPKGLLEKEGYQITVASSSLSEAQGMSGGKVKPDILLKEAIATDYDALVFVGGSGTTQYFNDPQALALAMEAKKHNKVIGAICLAPVILAKAGVLQGKKATVWGGEKGTLQKLGAVCAGKAVEIDDKIVTANGPAAAEEFGKTLIKILKGQPNAP